MRIWSYHYKEPLGSRALRQRAARLSCLVGGLMLLIDLCNAQQSIAEATATAQGTRGSLYVKVADDVVTVRAHDVAVKDLLKEIVRQTHLVVVLYDHLDEHINIELDRLPLPEAVSRILRAWNFALQYVEPGVGAAYRGETHRGRLWVFSRAWHDDSEHDDDAAGSSADIASTDIVLLHTASENEDAGPTEGGLSGSEGLEEVEAITPLSLALVDGDPEVRLDAVSELANIGSDEAAVALAVALSDEETRVREEAVDALGDIGGATAKQILEQAFMDTETDVREAAIDALADIGGDQSALALAVALRDQDTSLREEAVYALGRVGSESAIRVLKQAFMDQDNKVREAAVDAFVDIGGDASAEALAIVLRGNNVSLREQAVDALGEIGGETAIRLLQEAVEDEHADIREVAAETLAKLSDHKQ